jgi:hypothetical protein
MRTLSVCSVLLSSVMAFGVNQWQWVKATNTLSGWSVSQGQAEVVISGQHFEAKLFSDSCAQIALLKGTIQNGNVTAKERISASDFSDSTYHGQLTRKRWPKSAGTTSAESITLSDGWGMIGLSRSME